MGPTGPYLGTATVTLHSQRKSSPFCKENYAPIVQHLRSSLRHAAFHASLDLRVQILPPQPASLLSGSGSFTGAEKPAFRGKSSVARRLRLPFWSVPAKNMGRYSPAAS